MSWYADPGAVPAGENGCRTTVSGEGRRRKLYQPLEPSPSWHHGAALGVRRSCCGKAARSHRLQGSCISLGVEVHRLQGARSRVLYKPFVSTAWAPFAPDGGPLQLSSSAGIEFPQFVGTCPAMCGLSEGAAHRREQSQFAIAAASSAPPPRRRRGRLPVASGRGLLPWRLSAGASQSG